MYLDSLDSNKIKAKDAARDLMYSFIDKDIYEKIEKAKSLGEINRIMASCREKMR